MEIIGVIMAIGGLLLGAYGGIWLLVESFKAGVLWGLCYVFLPPAQLVFIILHWENAARPFCYYLSGVGLILLAVFLTGGS